MVSGDVRSLVEGVLAFLNDQGQVRSQIYRAAERVKKYYTSDVMTSNYFDAYAKVLMHKGF